MAALWYHQDMYRYIVISMGEAAGTSPEMILKAVNALSATFSGGVIVTGDEGVFSHTASDLSIDPCFSYIAENEEDLRTAEENGVQFIFYRSSDMDMSKFSYGKATADTGRAAYEALQAAVSIIQNGLGSCLVTTPVSSKALEKAGYEERSVFSLLSRFASSSRLINMIVAGKMNIFGLTHRRALSDALSSLTRENIIEALVSIDALKVSKFFDKEKPIAVCSLNPGDRDGEWTGPEESGIIIPAIEIAKRIGINVVGPISPESLFRHAAKGEYSAVLVMTASVGYAASAAAAPDESYMLTWGLPFLRLGIIGEAGLDDAGKGTVSIKPMVTAVLEGLRLSEKDYMV